MTQIPGKAHLIPSPVNICTPVRNIQITIKLNINYQSALQKQIYFVRTISSAG